MCLTAFCAAHKRRATVNRNAGKAIHKDGRLDVEPGLHTDKQNDKEDNMKRTLGPITFLMVFTSLGLGFAWSAFAATLTTFDVPGAASTLAPSWCYVFAARTK